MLLEGVHNNLLCDSYLVSMVMVLLLLDGGEHLLCVCARHKTPK